MKPRGAAPAAEDPKIPRQELIDAAAHLFAMKGYDSTSTRDIAAQVGKTPGSLYYHFTSKDDLLLAIYSQALAWAEKLLGDPGTRGEDAWQRLENICVAHLQALLERADYAVVVAGALPADAALHDQIVGIRNRWERLFRRAIADLPLKTKADKKYVRLILLGAMNYSQVWFRAGQESPAAVARKMVALMRYRVVV